MSELFSIRAILERAKPLREDCWRCLSFRDRELITLIEALETYQHQIEVTRLYCLKNTESNQSAAERSEHNKSWSLGVAQGFRSVLSFIDQLQKPKNNDFTNGQAGT